MFTVEIIAKIYEKQKVEIYDMVIKDNQKMDCRVSPLVILYSFGS